VCPSLIGPFSEILSLPMANTPPISSALSSLSLVTPRVSVEAIIHSDAPGIKTLLADFFAGAKLFAKIQRTDVGITKATIQGHPKQFPSSLEYLKVLLFIRFNASLKWGEASTVEVSVRLASIVVEDIASAIKRMGYSGELMVKDADEISLGGSATTEHFKKMGQTIAQSFLEVSSAIGITTGWIPSAKKEHILVEHNGRKFDLEVSTIVSLDELIKAVDKKFELATPFKLLYRLDEVGSVIVVTEVKDLQDGFTYHAMTVNRCLPRLHVLLRQWRSFTLLCVPGERMTSKLQESRPSLMSRKLTWMCCLAWLMISWRSMV
jgi:hypothetical protein